ncbi:multidrug resistance protein 3 (p glycoprotein 3) [Colletotrichum truncatum]|uniref:Multidrug resistance protein 3 (P glycoprotein 3) n=1 Tax=Colletotrichum truncatum TaxID=5467 RepID=A0ACC3Z3D6_COLTU|nr:multidrug resistance protein 3 (p glycoprotein 3) [Colletotrichum truncatum]KAF6793089.1 multidrug resistance protein 3 (p glycoprotein 3) [Colletotrichum truncatum]
MSMAMSFYVGEIYSVEGLLVTDDDSLESGLPAANDWDFVSSLHEDFNTSFGVSCSQFSGGQRQRIAIARAITRNSSVLLLNEATRALDTDSERIVQAALMEAAGPEEWIIISVPQRIQHFDRPSVPWSFMTDKISRRDLMMGSLLKEICTRLCARHKV